MESINYKSRLDSLRNRTQNGFIQGILGAKPNLGKSLQAKGRNIFQVYVLVDISSNALLLKENKWPTILP